MKSQIIGNKFYVDTQLLSRHRMRSINFPGQIILREHLTRALNLTQKKNERGENS